MKTSTIILISLLVLISLFIVMQAFVNRSSKNIETLPYTVLKDFEGFEIRAYPKANFSTISMQTSEYKQMSSNGFRVLAGYIFGGNDENKSIAMTSPVAMELGDSTTMKFMIPSEYEIDDLPKPDNRSIKFSSESAKVVAAIRYGGWTSDKKLEEKKSELRELLQAHQIEHNGKFTYLGYNPPYEVVNRRNEVIVELENYPLED